ncbi:hypothetical protein ACOJUR_14565 [Alicyclobacillus tolerans]|nr:MULTISPECIES: hypothetical protein [Alicyclobacillus]MDP9727989.1 putative DNA-binding protein YlxM (UPF0122 family) [Alicyclobacillus tengchongensis]QRF24281.1 hypothetical protein FY534_12085 [Alicyclobacillus sp. TC]
MPTPEEIGYADAIRQMQRALHRRQKQLQEQLEQPEISSEAEVKLQARLDEIKHCLEVLESIHR